MTREQLEEIRKAAETLPEKFVPRSFYNKLTQCYCWWGWIAKQLGHDAAEDGEYLNTWDFIDQRLDVQAGDTARADKIIETCGGHPECVREHMLWLLEKKVEASNA